MKGISGQNSEPNELCGKKPAKGFIKILCNGKEIFQVKEINNETVLIGDLIAKDSTYSSKIMNINEIKINESENIFKEDVDIKALYPMKIEKLLKLADIDTKEITIKIQFDA